MLTQAKIALVAAVLLSAVYIRALLSQALALFSSGANTWLAISQLASFFLFMALPVMLAVWSIAGTEIRLSNGLRWCALATAAVLGALLVLNVVTTALGLFRGYAPHGVSPWLVVRLLSEAALVILCAILGRTPRHAAPEPTGSLWLLKLMALSATLVAAVLLVLTAVQHAYSAKVMLAQHGGLFVTPDGHMESMNPPTPSQIYLGLLTGMLAPLCRFMIPLIVHRSLAAVPDRADDSATPDSLRQA